MKRVILTSLFAFLAVSALPASSPLDKYCGKYQVGGRTVISITEDDEKLVIDIPQFLPLSLTQQSDTVFSFAGSRPRCGRIPKPVGLATYFYVAKRRIIYI